MANDRALTRPLATYGDRHLRRYECSMCGQRADRKARGKCGAIYRETRRACERIMDVNMVTTRHPAERGEGR